MLELSTMPRKTISSSPSASGSKMPGPIVTNPASPSVPMSPENLASVSGETTDPAPPDQTQPDVPNYTETDTIPEPTIDSDPPIQINPTLTSSDKTNLVLIGDPDNSVPLSALGLQTVHEIENCNLQQYGIKPPRIEIFNGNKRDPEAVQRFIGQLESYFITLRIYDEGARLQVIMNHLMDDAHSWFKESIKSGTITNWTQFRKALRRQYIPRNYVFQIRNKLSRLYCTGDYQKYRNDFCDLVARIPEGEISEHDKLREFYCGLPREIRAHLCERKLTYFTARQAADMYDDLVNRNGDYYYKNRSDNRNGRSQRNPQQNNRNHRSNNQSQYCANNQSNYRRSHHSINCSNYPNDITTQSSRTSLSIGTSRLDNQFIKQANNPESDDNNLKSPNLVKSKFKKRTNVKPAATSEVKFTPGKYKPKMDLTLSTDPTISNEFNLPINSFAQLIESESCIASAELSFVMSDDDVEQSEVRRVFKAIDCFMLAKKLSTSLPNKVMVHMSVKNAAVNTLTFKANQVTFDLIDTFGSFKYNGVNFDPRHGDLYLQHFLHVALRSQNEGENSIQNDRLIINANNEYVLSSALSIAESKYIHLIETTALTSRPTPNGKQYKFFLDPKTVTPTVIDNLSNEGVVVPDDVSNIIHDYYRAKRIISDRVTDPDAIEAAFSPWFEVINLSKADLLDLVSNFTATVTKYVSWTSRVFNTYPDTKRFASYGDAWQLGDFVDNKISSPFKLSTVSTNLLGLLMLDRSESSFKEGTFVSQRHEVTVIKDQTAVYREALIKPVSRF